MKIGEIISADKSIVINNGKPFKLITVANTSDRPIQIGSHYHFFEVNRYLKFNREAAYGYHLDILSGTSVRFEPGEEKEVQLTAFGGERIVYGLNDLVCGKLSEDNKANAIENAKQKGFI